MNYKLGSLFDGSGGFPLAGALCGITPMWAAEVEPYPIAVTRSRFPNMKHLGDISKVNGAEIEPVDIITFGSPCQDLSVAGKRAGLKHEANGDEETTRSGLFMEAVRIIKEMRRATNGQYPRFALWENVPGAFSSNNGEDFRIVLEELVKIVEPSASMPAVPKNGWNYADSFVGDGWSLAYRVLDAQYWGVPQRRRRIYLVADFASGAGAREVLFEREGLRGYFAQGRTPWQTTPAHAEGSPGADDREGEGFDGYNGDLTGDKSATLGVNCGLSSGRNGVIERRAGGVYAVGLTNRGFCSDDKAETLRAESHGALPMVAYSFDSLASNSMKSSNPHSGCREVGVAKTLDTADPNPSKNQGGIAVVQPVPYTLKIRSGCEGGGKGALVQEDKSATLATNNDQYLFQPVPIHDQATRFSGKRGDKADGKGNGLGVGQEGDPMNTLTSGDRHAVAYGINGDIAGTLDASYYKGCGMRQGVERDVVAQPTRAQLASGTPATGTLCSGPAQRGFSGSQEIFTDDYHVVENHPPHYIVRRLTPTECASLQGFPDFHGHINQKEALTEDEYRFWQEVRNTHAAINGRAVKEYTERQMLTWYNKLWTDSAEYKMWGNGIALPTALYVVQGIADSLETEEVIEEWML